MVAIVDDKDQVIAESGGEVAYYSGVEGGERWSEGSQEENVFFKAPGKGTYRLLLNGSNGAQQGARPTKGGLSPGDNRGPTVTVDLYQGEILSRYFLFTFGAAILLPLFIMMRRRLFEQRRWAPVLEDDD